MRARGPWPHRGGAGWEGSRGRVRLVWFVGSAGARALSAAVPREVAGRRTPTPTRHSAVGGAREGAGCVRVCA